MLALVVPACGHDQHDRPRNAYDDHVCAVELARDIRHLRRDVMPLQWRDSSRALHELGPDNVARGIPEPPGEASDDQAWYRIACVRGPCPDGPELDAEAYLERVDRATGAVTRLTSAHVGLSQVAVLRDHVYFDVGHEHARPTSGLRRVRTDGTGEEDVRLYHGGGGFNLVNGLEVHDDRLYARSWYGVQYVGRDDSAHDYIDVGWLGQMAYSDGHVYVTDSGRGRERHGVLYAGTVPMVAPLREPTGVAVHGGRVFYMLAESRDIWSIPQGGGEPTRVVEAGRYRECDVDAECDGPTTALWADERGVFWLETMHMVHAPQRLMYLPWQCVRASRASPRSV